MTQFELQNCLIKLGFVFSGETNTRKSYTYQNMTVEIIYGKSKYGIAISQNGKRTQKMYQQSTALYVNVWAHEEAQKYVAFDS